LLALPEEQRRAELLATVRHAIATVLELSGTELVSRTAVFEDLGLTSLAAVEVRNVLARTLAASLPATIVLDNRTPEALADQLMGYLQPQAAPTQPVAVGTPAAEPEPRSGSGLPTGFEALYRQLCARGFTESAWEMVSKVAQLRPVFTAQDDLGEATSGGFRLVVGRQEPTLVCVPSVVSLAGRAEYKNFAAPFSGMRDVVQLGEIGFRDGEKLPADLDALVAAQIQAVRRRVPAGPVVLCGRSFGGWIAHAMAERMTELGDAPAGVVLLDTFWPGEEFVRKFIPRTLRRLVDRQDELGTELGMSRLTAIGSYLRMLAAWEPVHHAVPTLYVLPEDQTSIEQHLRSGGWRLPHTEIAVAADHFSILDGDASATADAVETWLAGIENAGGGTE
jgi:hypothetical protein